MTQPEPFTFTIHPGAVAVSGNGADALIECEDPRAAAEAGARALRAKGREVIIEEAS